MLGSGPAHVATNPRLARCRSAPASVSFGDPRAPQEQTRHGPTPWGTGEGGEKAHSPRW